MSKWAGMNKTVLVSGCFDLLHGGHIAFLKSAARYGDLYVAVGQDENLLELKGKRPYFTQEERCFIAGSISYVEEAFIAGGRGMLDFEPDLQRLRPDFFVVNQDGHTTEKEALCREYGVAYIVLERVPEPRLPDRSSSAAKRELRFPYRVCIAGGWLDQPWVSKIYPGCVVVAQIVPTFDFNDRSGMATSSRKIGIELWGGRLPEGDPVRNAQLLFGAENPPGAEYVSGSQDQIGLICPGVNRLFYNGGYWPGTIEGNRERDICEWLSDVLHFIPLKGRPEGYNPLKDKVLTVDNIKKLAEAGEDAWQGIINRDIARLGRGMTGTLRAWKRMLPRTVPDDILKEMEEQYISRYPGGVTSGCGGGYAVVASEKTIPSSFKIKIRY